MKTRKLSTVDKHFLEEGYRPCDPYTECTHNWVLDPISLYAKKKYCPKCGEIQR